jgi:hypothetical protein
MVNYRMALGAAAIAALFSGPAFADLITNGSFETNGGIGQLGDNTTATGWTVVPDSRNPGTATYGFIFSRVGRLSSYIHSFHRDLCSQPKTVGLRTD